MANNNSHLLRSNERNIGTSSSNSSSIGIHRILSTSTTSTNNRRDKELVTLQNPRPNKFRNANDYFDVNQQPKFKSENVLTSSSTSTNNRPTSALRLQQSSTPSNNDGHTNSSVRSSFDPCRRSSSADRGRFYNSHDSWNSSHFNDFVRVQIHSKLPSSSISSLPPSTMKLQRSDESQKNNFNKVIVGPGRPIRLVSKAESSMISSNSMIIASQPRKSRDSLNDRFDNGAQRSTKQSSNLCPRCNRCRCVDCTTSKSVPSKWICGNSVLCSLDTTVDFVSCMCCVKGCLYHTMGDDDGHRNSGASCSNSMSSDVDEERRRLGLPTKTNGHQRTCTSNCCLRWTIAGVAASFVLPCILCYYPLKCCAKMMSNGYARYHDYGCRCVERHPAVGSVGRLQPTRSSSANILPPPFPESNFEQSTKLTSSSGGDCGGVADEPTTKNRQLFTIHKPP